MAPVNINASGSRNGRGLKERGREIAEQAGTHRPGILSFKGAGAVPRDHRGANPERSGAWIEKICPNGPPYVPKNTEKVWWLRAGVYRKSILQEGGGNLSAAARKTELCA
jgi:hypothetical protein